MSLLEKLKQNKLLKIVSLNSGVIIFRLTVSLFIQRLIAQTIGEAGVAKVGSLRNLIHIFSTFSTGGVFNGIIKFSSEFQSSPSRLGKLFSTTSIFTLVCSLSSSLGIYLFSKTISQYLFQTTDYADVVALFSLVVPLIGLQQILQGFLNGFTEYKKHAKIELLSFVVSAGLVVTFLINFNLKGVLFAVSITPVIQLLTAAFVFLKHLWSKLDFESLKIDKTLAKQLLGFTSMTLVSSVLLNFVEIDIRSLISTRITIDEAGIWTAVLTISKNYMVFSTSIFAIYVIPKFSQLDSEKDFWDELKHIYRTILPLFAIGMIAIYFLREQIIDIIYPNFDGMSPLFKWQLLGDFIRLASIILAHQFLAKNLIKSFIISELFSLITFYALAYYLIRPLGIEGVVIAHLLRYIGYLILVWVLVKQYFRKNQVVQ